MTIIIPMAGKGERFLKAGYSIPKPLLPIGDIPMVIKAVSDLPKATSYIFLALQEHLKKFQLDDLIKKEVTQAQFISLNQVTEGQACTCLLALEHIHSDEEILIAACDNGMIFDREAFDELKKSVDVVMFTFRNQVTVVENPAQYGWAKLAASGLVDYVSVKKPISAQPKQDHAVVGAFWFKRSDIFKQAAEQMIAAHRRINKEFYVDECINDAIRLGYRVAIFEIDHYICWGTPRDYETFHYWKRFYEK